MKDYSALIEGCKKGKRNAQELLYATFKSLLFTICLRYAASREEAQDMLQEAFIKIFDNINTFKNEGSFEGWLKRITVNTALNYIRQSNKIFHLDLEVAANEVPEAKYSSQLELNDLLNLLNKLPMQKKVIFNLFEIEGFSHAEIAEMLKITESASRAQLSKAKEQLRSLFHNQTRL